MTNLIIQVQELKSKVDVTTRPPLPPFTRKMPYKKFVWRKMAGKPAIRERWLWLTRSIRAGEITPSLRMDGGRYYCAFDAQVVERMDYRLIKKLWAFTGNRIAVRFAYECRDDSGNRSASMAMKTGSSRTRSDAVEVRMYQ